MYRHCLFFWVFFNSRDVVALCIGVLMPGIWVVTTTSNCQNTQRLKRIYLHVQATMRASSVRGRNIRRSTRLSL